MRKIGIIILLALMLPFMAAAQDGSSDKPDAGSWTSLSLKHDFSPKYYLLLRGELRTKDNCNTAETWFLRAFNRYKFLPWLSGELNFEYNNSNMGDAWRRSFRIHLSAIASCKLGDFKLSTMQREYFYIASNIEPSSPCFLLSNYRVGYAPEGWSVSPYLSAFWLFRPEVFQRRLIAGADITLSPASSLNIYYMFKTAYPSKKDINVLGLGLTFKI